MRALIQQSIRFEIAAVEELATGRVRDFKFHPGLVEIALLGNIGVPDLLVLDDETDRDFVPGSERERLRAERRDDRGLRPALLQRKDVDTEDLVLQVLRHLVELFLEAVEEWYGRVRAQPA